MSSRVYQEFPGKMMAPWSLPERIISVVSPEFSTSSIAIYSGSPASGPWVAASTAVAYPFRLSYPVIAKQLAICNGSAAGGNFDLGIYDGTSLARLTSAGSTGGAGNNQWQFVDVADVTLLPGKVYYLAGVRDNTTANRQRFYANGGAAPAGTLSGIVQMASAFPLPDPFVPAANTTTSLQALAMACKAPY